MYSVIVLRFTNRLLESLLFQVLNHNPYPVHQHLPHSSDFIPEDALLITDQLPNHKPELTVLIVSGVATQTLPFNAAFGLVSHQSDVEEILFCLQAVTQGRPYVSPFLAQEQLTRLESAAATSPVPNPVAQLSRRQREVFALLRQGKTKNEIADQLFLSRHTVERHRADIQRELNLRGRNCLVRFAATHGM